MSRAGWATAGGCLRFALAFAFLNALLSFENRWPGFGVELQPRLSFELCLAVAALAGWVAWRGGLRRRAAFGLAGAFVLLVAVRYAAVTAPAVLGRPVNLYWDGRHGVELLRVALASLSPGQAAVAALAVVAGVVLLLLAVRGALDTLSRCVAWPRARPVLWLAVAALTLSFAAYVPDQRDTRWFFSLPLAPTLQQQAQLFSRVLRPAHAETVLGTGPGFDTGLDGLTGPQGPADVLLLFAESYGASSFDLPAVAAALAAPRAALAQAAADSGRGVVSARVRSPTFGGASWLAHASLLSGLPMSDPGQHELLLASQRPTLVSHFARHGYRTVGWMPGLKRAWPEGAFYGYQRLADDAGVGYAGPDFGYWRIPDQAAMARLHDQELVRRTGAAPERAMVAGGLAGPADGVGSAATAATAALSATAASAALAPVTDVAAPAGQTGGPSSDPPRFVVFATTSTHAPFHPLAPYVDDWARAGGLAAYSAAEATAALAAPLALQQPLPRYIDAMRYQFRWLESFLRQPAPRPLVLVLVGDHQPPALVAGASLSWDVPVHVFSTDPALLKRLQARGFASGMQPPATALGPMHELTRHLLQAFAGPGPGVPDRPPGSAASGDLAGMAAPTGLPGPTDGLSAPHR